LKENGCSGDMGYQEAVVGIIPIAHKQISLIVDTKRNPNIVSFAKERDMDEDLKTHNALQ